MLEDNGKPRPLGKMDLEKSKHLVDKILQICDFYVTHIIPKCCKLQLCLEMLWLLNKQVLLCVPEHCST